jgi:dTDP-glucose 4,6-dehydratase
MRVFVTGAAGFIGSHYVRTMLAGGYPEFAAAGDLSVTVFDKLTYAGNLANLASVSDDPRYSFVQGDICDGAALAEALPGHDVVVNFAAETHVDRSITGASDFVVTNVLGAQTLFEACVRAGIERVVHVSTDEVYGTIPIGSWTEDHILEPNSPYAAAKAGGDLLARAYAGTFGLNLSVTRCTNNYGHFQFPEKVIPLFVTNLIDGLKVPLYGDGMNIRDWLHVDDHCRGIQLVVEKGEPAQFYNIGGGIELTNKELTQKLLDACGADWNSVEYVEDRKNHDLRYSLDDARLRAMGYQPQTGFDEGLAKTVQWFRDNEAWWRPLKEKAKLAK